MASDWLAAVLPANQMPGFKIFIKQPTYDGNNLQTYCTLTMADSVVILVEFQEAMNACQCSEQESKTTCPFDKLPRKPTCPDDVPSCPNFFKIMIRQMKYYMF